MAPILKGWPWARINVMCKRAWLSVLNDVTVGETELADTSALLSDHSTIDVDVDPSSLAKLVKEKNLDQIQQLGGINGIIEYLKTDVNNGLVGDMADFVSRKEKFGTNTYPTSPVKSFFHFLLIELKDATAISLIISAAFSLGFGIYYYGMKQGWHEAGSMLIVTFTTVSVCSVSYFMQSRQFDKFSIVGDNVQVEIVRNGRQQKISIFEVVVGDIVFLKIGDQIPADGLLLEEHSDSHFLQVDESSMSGESDLVEVTFHQNPFMFSGTYIADVHEYAKMVVTSVGMDTSWGEKMSKMPRDSSQQTPLLLRLEKLSSVFSMIGLLVASIILVLLLVRYFTGKTVYADGTKKFNGSKIVDMIYDILGIIISTGAIIIVAIPQGLALVVALTLTYSMKQMMAEQAIMRNLSACEILGSATTICTDFTGTLTLNQLKVTEFWLGQKSITGAMYTSLEKKLAELLQQGIILNSTGSLHISADSNWEFSSSPTEEAIFQWAKLKFQIDVGSLREKHVIVHVKAFNSEEKRRGVLMKKATDNILHTHWKGDAHIILAKCTHYYDHNGNVRSLDHNNDREIFELKIHDMASRSLRCIAFAHNQAPNLNDDNGLTLLGIVGLEDPCRPDVKEAVENCQKAGVNIKIITCENLSIARAIATQCGILKPDEEINGQVIEGSAFSAYSDDERMEKVGAIRVMARSSPSDKLLMVKCLKENGLVVAVTGDDVPALKEADIGLSMGIQGSQVARQSSDIVILDDNFASVFKALKWGRYLYINIKSFIQFQLTVKVATLTINFVVVASGAEDVPLTIVQLLWIDIIVDILVALALATEKPSKELMKKPPVSRSDPLITNIMWRNSFAQALYQITSYLTLYFLGEWIFGVTEAVKDTLIFNTYVLSQLFNLFNAREMEKKNVFKGIHKNKLFMVIIGVTLILQVVMVEFLNKFADTERLNLGQWGTCIGIAFLSWPIDWVIKFVPVPEKPFLDTLSSIIKGFCPIYIYISKILVQSLILVSHL